MTRNILSLLALLFIRALEPFGAVGRVVGWVVAVAAGGLCG